MADVCPWCDPSVPDAARHTRNIVLFFNSGRLWHCSDLVPHLIKEHELRPPSWVAFQEDVLGRKLVIPSELRTVIMVEEETRLDWDAIRSRKFTKGKMCDLVYPKVVKILESATQMWHAATVPKLGDLVARDY